MLMAGAAPATVRARTFIKRLPAYSCRWRTPRRSEHGRGRSMTRRSLTARPAVCRSGGKRPRRLPATWVPEGSAVHTHGDLFEDSLDVFRVSRLRQVVVESRIGGALSISSLAPSRQRNDSCAGEFAIAAQLLRDLHAVHAGHADIQQNQVRLVFQCR